MKKKYIYICIAFHLNTSRYISKEQDTKQDKASACSVLRTDFVPCFSVIVIVTVIVLYAMFILQLWTELKDKHCWYHYDYDYDRTTRYMPPSIFFLFWYVMSKSSKRKALQRRLRDHAMFPSLEVLSWVNVPILCLVSLREEAPQNMAQCIMGWG